MNPFHHPLSLCPIECRQAVGPNDLQSNETIGGSVACLEDNPHSAAADFLQ